MTAYRSAIPASAADWKDWDDFARSHPDASVYHLFGWARVLKRAFDYDFRGFFLRDETGAIAAIVPLYRVDALIGHRLVGVPFRDRGGVLARNADAERAAYAEARIAADQFGAKALVLKSCAPMDEDGIRAEGFSVSRYWVQSVMTLGEGELWNRIGKKNRNMVRQAEKAGLKAEWKDATALEGWLRLHATTQHRLGVPVFPRALFEAILDEGRDWARLLLVMNGDRAVAGGIFFTFARRYVYGYSASTLEGQESRANDLMLFEALKEAERSGAGWFDFGSDSPKQDSLLAFKSKWGATQSQTMVAAIPPGDESARDSSSGLYSAARAIGRRLPQSLWAGLTSPLVKRLG